MAGARYYQRNYETDVVVWLTRRSIIKPVPSFSRIFMIKIRGIFASFEKPGGSPAAVKI